MTREQQLKKEFRLAHLIQLIDGRHEEYKIFGRTPEDAERDEQYYDEMHRLKMDLTNAGHKECRTCNGEGIYRYWNEERILASDPCSHCRGCGLLPT